MKTTISVEKLSKRYRLGDGSRAPYRTLRESITDAASGAWRRLTKPSKNGKTDTVQYPVNRRKSSSTSWPGSTRPASPSDEIWALKDVSFSVRPGEVLGVIGRNGAGKSTLLKILSQITHPTSGQVDLWGRVGSLLEVGTGFHPELTGRENIFLNGSILGMSRAEVTRKFDEIVAFSEIERFLDTPVKRYSSGMYTRLAFAVASHLEPEILIVDEVLAVGDAAFQKKCLGKMGQVSRHGRTVLFVSHQMTAVKSLCTRAILMENGQVAMDGDVDQVVDRYLSAGSEMSRTGIIPENAPRIQDVPGEALFRSVRLTDQSDKDVSQLYFGQPFRITLSCEILKEIPDGHFEISISARDGTQVTYSTTMDGGNGPTFLEAGTYEVTAEFDMTLLPRDYTIDLGVHHITGTTSDYVQGALHFTVLRVAGSGNDHYPWPKTRGFVRAPTIWKLSCT
jgi:lipopolysaccharide transport system ATP-binding protein